MLSAVRLLCCSFAFALVAPSAAASQAKAEKVAITWGKQQFTSDKLPDKLGPEQRKVIAEWEPWAQKHEYRMSFDTQARVLLLTRTKSSQSEDQQKHVDATVTWFDKVFPVPKRAANAAASQPAAAPKGKEAPAEKPPADGEPPEDPESAPKGAPAPPTAPTPTTAWGLGTIPPDTQTAVLLAVYNEDDLQTAVDHLAANHPELKAWAERAGSALGFVLEIPLCAAMTEVSSEADPEWDPRHELISRVARMLMLRRFSQLPLWASYGVAWEAEMQFDGLIFVYPFREEFVSSGEHDAWPRDIQRNFKERQKHPLELSEFATIELGSYDGAKSRLAWGFMHWLAKEHAAKVSPLFEEMRLFRDANDRVDIGDNKWERNPEYAIPLDDQLAIIKKHCGADALDKASAYFRKISDDPNPKELKKAIKK